MIDLHCHILPGLDDGSPNTEESLAMAAMAADTGTGQIVCTPHCSAGDDALDARCARIRRRTERLNALLARNRIPLQLHPGMELLCTEGLEEVLDRRAVLTLAGSRYLLIEFDFGVPAQAIEHAAWCVMQRGLTPVLAHPERYTAVQRDPGRMAEWFAGGCVIQVNKGSILGRFGPQPARAADWILDRGLAHVVASDAHRSQIRTPRLDEVHRAVGERFSYEYADILLEHNPRCILQDRPLLRPDEI